MKKFFEIIAFNYNFNNQLKLSFLPTFPIVFIFGNIKQIIKTILSYFIELCIIINIIIFVFIRKNYVIENVFKSVIFTILLLIPIFVSLIMLNIKKKDIMNNNTLNLIQVLLVIGTFIYLFFVIIFADYILAVDGVNNIKNYNKVCSLYKIKICPNKISKTAKKVYFHYNAPFFQGGEKFNLFFQTDTTEIQNYKKKYENNSKWINNYNLLNNDYYFLKNRKNEELFQGDIENIKVYFLDGRCDNSGYCNHGEYNAIFINEKNNSIMFNYEKW